MDDPMRIQPGDLDDAQIRALLTEHLREMRGASPPGTSYALDLSGLQRPDISLYAAWRGDALLGVGALRELGPRHGEIKSMRTAAAHLGQGVGRALLEHLIGVAHARGYERVSLETGSGPVFEAALSLYRRRGFVPGGPFGDYRESPFNQFFHLELAPEPSAPPGPPAT
jgi:putative acetyltransferase